MSKIPVFIVGINPRSGTNYLYQLLASHPECVRSNHYGEDFILIGLDKYLEFYDKVTCRWKKKWHNDQEDFRKALESGILKYLDPVSSPAKLMITKTPYPNNATLFLKAFTQGYLIVITRNGQDLVESYITSFNRKFEDVVREWVGGARVIDAIKKDPKMMKSGRVILLKYEELYQHNQQEMTRLLEFLQLDVSQYDFAKSRNLDVIGSSTFKGESAEVTWVPIPKDHTFNPLNRFEGWSKYRHYRFNWLAGKYSKSLGYQLYFESRSPLYYIYNIALTTYKLMLRIGRRTKIILNSFGKRNTELKRALDIQEK
ncbi:MAG: sulfotransferase [Ginsengibacter sp.]